MGDHQRIPAVVCFLVFFFVGGGDGGSGESGIAIVESGSSGGLLLTLEDWFVLQSVASLLSLYFCTIGRCHFVVLTI